jgi:hypothetical protein
VDPLPANLVDLLAQINGFVLFGGGLRVRGECTEPTWDGSSGVRSGLLIEPWCLEIQLCQTHVMPERG